MDYIRSQFIQSEKDRRPYAQAEERANFLPLATNPYTGKTGAAVPSFVTNMADAFMAPGAVLAGQKAPTVEDAFGVAGAAITGGFGAGAAGMNMGGKGALGANRFTLDYYGTPVKVVGNPTAKELEGFLGRTKYKAARRIQDPATGDVYVWDAADPALHAMVAKQLGIDAKKMIADMIGID